MNNCEFKLVSSLEKVFPRSRPKSIGSKTLSGLKGEILSFQIAYKIDNVVGFAPEYAFQLGIESDLKSNMRVRRVNLVPSLLAAYESHDTNYITTDPGMLPDLLTDVKENEAIILTPTQWRALWIDVELMENLSSSDYTINLETKDKEGKLLWKDSLTIEVINMDLPEQELIRTEWFHGDCLADYYNVEVFSERHWEIVENFIETATKNGVNMILTPVITPPLDTDVGGERTTIQLVDVYLDNNKYTFKFDNLKKWIDICTDKGVKYLEIAHLFTQWGAHYTPKIMATVDGVYKRIFGWDVDATSEAYKGFIDAFLPELLVYLASQDFNETNTYFHISDEPTLKHLESYKKAKDMVSDHLKGYKIIDALSDYDFYKNGLVENPVPGNDRIHDFTDNNVEDLWVYYCCAQTIDVSNRFMAMPSARTRIIGLQMYLYDIKGFLHWGYNFYSSRHSIEHINPYVTTDSKEAFASGDPFLVYPGKDGKPEESIRLVVFNQALNDLRALKLLEDLTSREHVERIIYTGIDYKITFSHYPTSMEYIEDLRAVVNQEIKKHQDN